MVDNDIEVADASQLTQLVPDRDEPEARSIRSALEQQINNLGGVEEIDTPQQSSRAEEQESSEETYTQTSEAVSPLLPPADMNRYEKEAYLNPTPQNAHILQQYLNRRAYETRSDYQRKMQEVETLKSQTASFYDTIKEYEDFYARDGIPLTDVAKRSISWDRAMREDPVGTAIEWLSSYGVNINDLTNYGQYQPEQYPQEYLTREDAERIAEEKLQAIQEEQQQKAVEYYNQRAVESFKSSKPVFRDPETAMQLEADMTPVVAALTSTGRYSSPEEILETAYNYVINGNPTYSTIARTMSAKTEIKEQQAAVAKAKTASRSISGSPGSGTPTIQAKNLRDNLLRRLND